ncbi:MAG: PDZ domain-containing protein [Chitinophagaceae bacterium]
MKQLIKKTSLVLVAAAAMMPAPLLAQDIKEDKKKETEHIIITRKGDKDEKVVIEINGDKVTVNGKAVDDKNGDITVQRSKDSHVWAYSGGVTDGVWNDNFALFNGDDDRAMLGVTTEANDKGAQIKTITKDGGAEKAGLKTGDIIKKIGDSKIEGPDDLSAAIRKQKPGDKVSVTFLRDGKEQTVTAELVKWKGFKAYGIGQQNYNMNLNIPDIVEVPHMRLSPSINGTYSWSGGAPRLGLSVQDTDDGKGAKVIDVDEDGNAFKAGLKEDDILTEIDGKAVNSADEVAKVVRESKDKVSVNVKLLRQGKTENITVKIPRRLKTANL